MIIYSLFSITRIVCMNVLSGWSKKITVFFNALAETTSIETGFIKRVRKLTGSAFLKAMVFSNLSDACVSIDRIRQWLGDSAIQITKQGLDFRFTESAVEFWESMFTKSRELFHLKAPINCNILDQFNSVKLLDSSYINLPRSLKNRYTG